MREPALEIMRRAKTGLEGGVLEGRQGGGKLWKYMVDESAPPGGRLRVGQGWRIAREIRLLLASRLLRGLDAQIHVKWLVIEEDAGRGIR